MGGLPIVTWAACLPSTPFLGHLSLPEIPGTLNSPGPRGKKCKASDRGQGQLFRELQQKGCGMSSP